MLFVVKSRYVSRFVFLLWQGKVSDQGSYWNEGEPPSPDILQQVRELNRRAVAAFLDQMQGVSELCLQALALAAPAGVDSPVDAAGAAEALQTLGRMALAQSDFSQAFDCFHKSVHLYESCGLARETALARSYLGITFADIGDYSRGAETLRQALTEAENIPDTLLAAEIMNDLSYTYVEAGQPEMALQNLLRSIQIFRDAKDDMRLAWTLESLGQAYLQVGEQQQALACVHEALELVDHSQFLRDVTRFRQIAGHMYKVAGDLAMARVMFSEELELARKYGLRGDECSALISLAALEQDEGRYAQALPLLLDALGIVGQTSIKPHLRQCCLQLSEVYKHLNDYPQALAFHERFYQIDKEIFNAETDHRMRSVQALYQLDAARKEAELYQLRAQALQLEVEERRRTEIILERAARTDPLTGILNRRAFFELAEKAFGDAVRTRSYFSIILIDLDNFKLVNDTHGHLVGDQTLVLVAERLRRRLRARDSIARYGGEEFIILLQGVHPDQALDLANRLRQAVAGALIEARGVLVPVTLSLGVSSMTPDLMVENLDMMVSQADRALYKAKNQGRNIALSFDQIADDPRKPPGSPEPEST